MDYDIRALSDAVPEIIGQAACHLHTQRTTLLVTTCPEAAAIQPPENQLWKVVGDQIEFPSFAAKNLCTAIHVLREEFEYSPLIPPDRLFDVAHEIWRHEIGDSDLASGRFLALTEERINVLHAATLLISNSTRPTFDILGLVEAALPYLPRITVSDLISVVVAQHSKTQGDLAYGRLFSSIQKTLATQPPLAWELYDTLRSGLGEATNNLYGASLVALSNTEELDRVARAAIEDARSPGLLGQAATWVLGRLLAERALSDELTEGCIEVLTANAKVKEDKLRLAAIHALSVAAPKHMKLNDNLVRLASMGGIHVCGIVADYLLHNLGALVDAPDLPRFLNVLLIIEPGFTSAIDSMDSVLAHLIRSDKHSELALRWLTDWLRMNREHVMEGASLVKSFDQVLNMLVGRPQLLSSLVTDWFLSEEPAHAVSCGEVISFVSIREVKGVTLSRERLDNLDIDGLIFLVRRILGYVYNEDILLSLIFSLLDTTNPSSRTHSLVESLLVNEIGNDYPSVTLEAITLRTGLASADEKSMLDRAHEKIMAYEAAIDSLPMLHELRPPLQLRRAIALKKSVDMRKSMDAANEKSIWRQLATQVPLKGGVGWFSVENGHVGEVQPLRSMSHSILIPRRAVSDPIGYEIQRLGFRIVKRGSE